MKTNKYFLILLTSMALFTMSSCLESDDLITKNAKHGGLIDAPSVVPFKNADINLSFTIYKGAEVQKVMIYKSFTHKADTSFSDEYLLTTVDVGGANVNNDVEKTLSFSWAELKANIPQLPKGYTIPDNGIDAEVGDYFTLYFKSVMSDGREVIGPQTLISVANFFAGNYTAHLIYRHPNAGTYPDNIYVEEDNSKTLLAVSGTTCVTSFATWGPNEKMYITIDPNNNYAISITTENWSYNVELGDPNRPDLVSNYDPNTGVLTLYYHYYGSNGPRIFWETFTPVE